MMLQKVYPFLFFVSSVCACLFWNILNVRDINMVIWSRSTWKQMGSEWMKRDFGAIKHDCKCARLALFGKFGFVWANAWHWWLICRNLETGESKGRFEEGHVLTEQWLWGWKFIKSFLKLIASDRVPSKYI